MYFAFLNELARQTPWDLYVRNTTCAEQVKEFLAGNYFLLDGSLAEAECIKIGWRDHVTSEATVAILAIFTHQAQEGRLPESFKELTDKGLLARAPMDSFSGAPLVYKADGDDFTLYSVGEDFVDDGGLSCAWNDESGGDHVFWPIPDELR